MANQQCLLCNATVTRQFTKANGKTYYRSYCSACAKLIRKKTTTEYNLERNLFKYYGITTQMYLEKLNAQDYECAICCDVAEYDHSDPRYRRLHVDHNKATGEVRGLLCFRCNLMLGFARESATNLERAKMYLAKYGAA